MRIYIHTPTDPPTHRPTLSYLHERLGAPEQDVEDQEDVGAGEAVVHQLPVQDCPRGEGVGEAWGGGGLVGGRVVSMLFFFYVHVRIHRHNTYR